MKPRKDGYYHKNFTYEGRRYHISAGTEKELMIKYGKMLQQLADGSLAINQNSTVLHWSEVWLDTYKAGNMTEKSLLTYRQKLDGYILPAIGRMKMKDVREPHLQRILNDEKGRSFSHVSKLRMVIRSMFSRALSAGIINRDPSANLILPKTTKGTHRSLTERERAAVLAVANSGAHKSGLLFKFLLYSGLRPGEVIALQWKDIDFRRKVIRVTKAVESGSRAVKGPKTNAGIRDDPIKAELLADLRAAKRGPFEPVFHQATDETRPHTENSFRCAWKSFRRLVDIQMGATVYRNQVVRHGEPDNLYDSLTPYCLRHTYCTDLQDAGVPLNVAKYLMGHSDVSVTANIYTHTSDDAIKQAARLIDASPKEQRG